MKKKTVTVSVKTNSGVELKIESDIQTVKDIVAEIHRRAEQRARFREVSLKSHEMFINRVRLSNTKRSHNKTNEGGTLAKTKTDMVLDLKKSNFFDEPRTIGDLQKAMDAKGYHYQLTSLSPLLIRLVRRGILSRSRYEKGWVYTAGG